MHCYCNTTQRSRRRRGRAGRRRHGCERRRKLRVEVRRGGGRRDRWCAERVGVRGVVRRHARPPPQFLHCFLERRDELVGHVGHLLDFPVKAHGLRREGVLVDRFWGPRGRRRGRGQSVVNKSQWSLVKAESSAAPGSVSTITRRRRCFGESPRLISPVRQTAARAREPSLHFTGNLFCAGKPAARVVSNKQRGIAKTSAAAKLLQGPEGNKTRGRGTER